MDWIIGERWYRMLTIKQVMDFEIMESTKLLTTEKSIENCEVEWVSVIEIPVENFVRKNEFVLSTGIGCGHDTKLLKQFVSDLYEAGASAIGLAMGRYIFDIPKEIIAFAEERNFPVIQIPWEIRFSEIQHAVMTTLNRLQEGEIKQYEAIQQKLLNLVLKSHNLSKVADFIEKEIGYPILITNKAGTIKGKSSNSVNVIDKWKECLHPQKEAQILSTLNDSQHPLHTRIERVECQDFDVLQIPVQTADIVQGYLIVFLPEGAEEEFLITRNLSILEQASTTLTMWFLRENAIEETELRLRGDFVWSLAKGDIISWDHALAQAKSLGYDINLPYICVVGFPEKMESLYRKYKTKALFQQWEKSIFHYIEDEAYHASEFFDRKVMVTSQNKEVIIYIEATNDPNHDNVKGFLDLVDRRLTNLLPGVEISWGIGRYHQGDQSFSSSFQDAKIALKIGRRKKGAGARVSFDDTKVERTLLSLATHPEMKEIVYSTIAPLMKYDEERDMDLIRTFTAYHQNQGKVSQTSRVLNLHRQSLLYRLRKIEMLSGLSLVDPDDRFLLDLSIKIWTLGVDDL
jgi:purine catabolism regulator